MERHRAQEHVRPDRAPGGNAVGRRRGRHRPRRARGGRPHHNLHGQPGPAPDDTQHVQDSRRTAARRLPCLGPHRVGPRPFHLRRSLGRHGLPPDRLCPAGLGQSAGSDGYGRRGPPRRHPGQAALPAFLRRLPHQPRNPEDRRLRLQGAAAAGGLGRGGGVPGQGAQPRASRHPRHHPEPGHFLPAAGSRQPLLHRPARHRSILYGRHQPPHRPRLPPFRLLRRAPARERRHRHGIGLRRGAGGGGPPQRRRRQRRHGDGAPLPAVFGRASPQGHPGVGAAHRRSRPDQGTGRGGRTPLHRHPECLLLGRPVHAHRRRPLRPFVERYYPGPDPGRVREPGKGSAQGRIHHRHRRRRHQPVTPDPARTARRGRHLCLQGLGHGQRRHGGRQQEQRQDCRRRHRLPHPGVFRL